MNRFLATRMGIIEILCGVQQNTNRWWHFAKHKLLVAFRETHFFIVGSSIAVHSVNCAANATSLLHPKLSSCVWYHSVHTANCAANLTQLVQTFVALSLITLPTAQKAAIVEVNLHDDHP